MEKLNLAKANSILVCGLILLASSALASKILNINDEIKFSNSDEFSDKSTSHNNNKDNESSSKSKNIVNINNNNNDNQNGDEQMPVNDQISLLSKRLEILTEHREEDYRMLERSLHSYVQKHLHEYINVDIKKELKDLR